MSGGPRDARGPRGGGPRGWLLALLVLGALVAAAWLFWSEARDEDRQRAETAAPEERELAEGVLDVPDPDEQDDDRRRGEEGRSRLDAGTRRDRPTGDDGASSDDDGDASAEPLPAVFANLRGRRVSLAPASARGGGDPRRVVKAGGVRVACARRYDADRLAHELAVLERLAQMLDRAGAEVVLLGAEGGDAGCVDVRVGELHDSELALVARAGAVRRPHALPGRPGRGIDAKSRRESVAFAAELAAALGAGEPVRRTTPALDRLLAESAAIDRPGGAATAMVDLPPPERRELDDVATALGRAIAITASKASRETE